MVVVGTRGRVRRKGHKRKSRGLKGRKGILGVGEVQNPGLGIWGNSSCYENFFQMLWYREYLLLP